MNHGISIIIPLYNKAHAIERALDSVFSQDDERYEVIVVNDESTDESREIVMDRYGSRLKLLDQKNGGPSVARNTGAAHATKKYLLFLDADDELVSDCISTHLRAMEWYPLASLCISSHQIVSCERIEDTCLVSESGLVPEAEFACSRGFNPSLIFGVHMPCVAVGKGIFMQVNGFDERLRCWEVTDLLFRINLLNSLIAYTDNITVRKYKDLRNSQFEKEKRNASYINVFSRNIISRIDEVPFEHRARILAPVSIMQREMFIMQQFGAYRDIAAQACGQFRKYDVPARTCYFYRLPDGVLRFLVGVKSTVWP